MQHEVKVKKARTQICVYVKRVGTYVTRYSIAGTTGEASGASNRSACAKAWATTARAHGRGGRRQSGGGAPWTRRYMHAM